jgi:hypothetical protein
MIQPRKRKVYKNEVRSEIRGNDFDYSYKEIVRAHLMDLIDPESDLERKYAYKLKF